MNPLAVRQSLQQWLIEDIGPRDLTSELLFPASARASGRLIAKRPGRIAGLEVARLAFASLDQEANFTALVAEGADVEAGSALAEVDANARSLFAAERVALNLLQRLSGVATITRDVCRSVAHTQVAIADTRKTVPGLRMFDKYAVAVGGGRNHRFGLHDAVLIKDNHIAAAGSLPAAVRRVQAGVGHTVIVEVEADTLEQVAVAAELGVHAILLDNMSPEDVRRAVALIAGRTVSEASGGITPYNVQTYAETGVDVISLGWLTHSVTALDISFDMQTTPNREDGR